MPLSSCPVCGGRIFEPAVPAAALTAEIEQRDRFIASHLHRKASPAELKDLTDFMHGGEAAIVRCCACGLLFRQEAESLDASSYGEDPNDPDLMDHLLPRYIDAFRRKASAYRDLLPPHAFVIEPGSHLGGFLQVAGEWNWDALGLDVGCDTSDFARRKGLAVRREMIEDTKIGAGNVDAVTIWNCFEQIGDPQSTLLAARRLLKRGGLLVIRVPNARAWLQLRDRRTGFAQETLAWNNLLGFPYLYGYTEKSLNRLLCSYGFEPAVGYNSELLTLPFPDVTPDVAGEQRAISRKSEQFSQGELAQHDHLAGPWLEVVYRKQEEVRRTAPKLLPYFLPRAS